MNGDHNDDQFDDERIPDPRAEKPVDHGDHAAHFAAGHLLLAVALLAFILLFIFSAMSAAKKSLEAPPPHAQAVPVATPSNLGYCTDGFKAVLRRVLDSCGLLTANSRRGCTPGNVKQVAAISGADFNALFSPLADRGAILEFPAGGQELDPSSTDLLDQKWTDTRGASIFLVVARASPEGSPEMNQALSHKRANSVLFHLEQKYHDPELEQKVGLLWLGEEYAQLSKDFCKWQHNDQKGTCNAAAINRSAFVTWIDCQL